jgi:hypothetical protein
MAPDLRRSVKVSYRGFASYSPDGSKIVYARKSNPEVYNGEPEVYIANADGSSPTPITEWVDVEYPIEPEFSPDGTKIVFAAFPPEGWPEQIFTVNTDGSELKQLTNSELWAAEPHWSTDGSKIVYTHWGWSVEEQLFEINADGSGEPESFAPSIEWSDGIAFSPVGSTATVSDDEYLGANFEPLLRFHGTEKWRPLNVASFMTEEDPENAGHSYNKLCTEEGCEDIPSAWQLAMQGAAAVIETKKPHIKMGKLSEETYPTSPNVECYGEVVQDCDSGPRTAMYYHVVPSANGGEKTDAGYNYLDYWMFYRYNQDQNDPFSLDDHEGDWEGLTVAPSVTNPSVFDFAIFAQHGDHSVYAPENLQCDGGGEGSCGSELFPGGQRVWDFVAVGTHASYPSVDEGVLGVCLQARHPERPEGCHDGAAPWEANYGPNNVLAFPPAIEGNWVDWPGLWGEDEGGALPGTGASPESPGRQDRFKCPWSYYPEDSTACPSSVQRNPSRQREAIASACGNWFGGMVAMTACSPSDLRRAVHAARMGRRGSLRISLETGHGHAASRSGVAQAVGAPLRVGQTAEVTGRSPGDTELLVRAQEHGQLTEAVFRGLSLQHGGRGHIRVLPGTRGANIVWMTPTGRRLHPAKIRFIRLPKVGAVRQRITGHQAERPAAAAHHAPKSRSKTNRRACRRAMMTYLRAVILKSRATDSDPSRSTPAPRRDC